MKLILKLLAPFIAVGIFWCVFRSAWLALLAYHAQILLWSRHRLPAALRGRNWRALAVAAPPCALAGPLLYVLLPEISTTGVGAWFSRYDLVGASLVLMIPYFGILHPILEQAHWSELRSATPLSHAFFAGYHAIVLSGLLSPAWLGLCCVVLLAASIGWQVLSRRSGGLFVPSCAHVLADLGIVLAGWLRAS